MEIKKLENSGVQLIPETASDHFFLGRFVEMAKALNNRAAESVAAERAAGAMAKVRLRDKEEMDSELLDIREAAKYLTVSVPTLRKWCFERQITIYKIGRAVRFKREV